MTRVNGDGWYTLRFKILERDEFTCQYCGQVAPDVVLHVDHKIAVADGGTNSDENLITSCSACNRGKEGLRISRVARQENGRVASMNSLTSRTTKALELGPKSHKQIAQEIGANPNSVRVGLYGLLRQGVVAKVQRDLWQLSSSRIV